MEKVPTPLCTCLEKAEQTARHLMLECSILLKESPTVLQNLPPPPDNEIPHKHIDVSRFFKAIFHMLQDQSKRDQIP